MSTITTGRQRRALATFFISAVVRIGSRAPVELITTSALASSSGSSPQARAVAPSSAARCAARSGERLVTTSPDTPAVLRWRAARVDILPAPITSTCLPPRSPNTRAASSTATDDTLAAPLAIAVSVRTRLAALHARSRQRLRIGPAAPVAWARA